MPVIITKDKNAKNLGEMDRLPETKSKNGYMYTLVERNDVAAIYEQLDPEVSQVVGYEVFKVTTVKPSTIMQKNGKNAGMFYQYPETEKFPGNEDFGKIAWAYNTLPFATKKYEELTNA